jgi:hypothetical protein
MSAFQPGTVIHGTLNVEDTLPAFMEELDNVREAVMQNDWPETDPRFAAAITGSIDNKLGRIERRMKRPGYFESEDAMWDLEEVTDALNGYAPDGYYFGAHEGDGSDFGWWEHEDEDD